MPCTYTLRKGHNVLGFALPSTLICLSWFRMPGTTSIVLWSAELGGIYFCFVMLAVPALHTFINFKKNGEYQLWGMSHCLFNTISTPLLILHRTIYMISLSKENASGSTRPCPVGQW